MASWTSGYVADLGYTHGFYRELSPALLSFVALARGQWGPDASSPLSYCELGCGQGFSANLLAAANPHVQFYATDFNPAHIVNAQALQRQAGTTNISFFEQSFSEFLNEPSLPQFDIISVHGIFSWVPAEHRATIVEFLRRKLKPRGVVYISYNALPGWAAAAPMRHLMYMHGRNRGGTTASRLDPALQFVERIIASQAVYFRSNPGLKDRFERLKLHHKNYVAHEYLNDTWNPFYHSEVAQELGDAKLTFLGSASMLEQIDQINLTPEQQAILSEESDSAFRETIKDYLIGQQFRRDVFVRGGVQLTLAEAREAWMEMRFALSTLRSEVPLKVNGVLGEATLDENVYNPLLDAFAEGPRTLKEIVNDPRIGNLGWARLVQSLSILIGAGHLQPALRSEDEHARKEQTRRFNAAVCHRAKSSGELQALASPVIGSGISLDRFEQLFVAAYLDEEKNVVGRVWNVLQSHGQGLVKDGKALTPEENQQEIKKNHEHFMEKRVPLLKQLHVI